MNRSINPRHILLPALAAALLAGAAACNKKSAATGISEYETATSVAVSKMTLKSDSKILSNLDSVFFSIDLNHGVIFNADSLPKGTDVSRLIPVITYSGEVTEATLTFDKDGEQKVSDYKSNPSDSIDFSHPVRLSLKAGDTGVAAQYIIKVNVHRNDPDSLIWDDLAVGRVPSRMADPRSQKTVAWRGRTATLVEESDGSYTWATTADLYAGQWSKSVSALPSAVRVRTMRAAGDAVYVLAEDGSLLESSDGLQWSLTGQTWAETVGAYGSVLLGIAGTPGSLRHVAWPAGAVAETPLEDGFPVSGFSAFGLVENRWASQPTGLMTGGRLADGALTAATWAFDGDSWARLDLTAQPPVEGAVVVPYLFYRPTNTSWVQREFDCWLLLGGRLADGSLNDKVYMTLNNGVNWAEAPQLMQLPPFMRPGWQADGVIAVSQRQADLADAWVAAANPALRPWMRIAYETDGYQIRWEAPYLYLVGGLDASGAMSDQIWRGVLARLNYAPLL